MSVDMDTAQGSGSGRSQRYELELDGTEGTTYLGHSYEGGETSVDIEYMADPEPGRWGGSLSAEERIGVNNCDSQACRYGVAGSHFDVEELSSSSEGDFNQGTYEITAQGVGQFGVDVAETVTTCDPSQYERDKYELDGDGTFALSGEYGFRGDVEGEPGSPTGAAATSDDMTSEGSLSAHYTLSISGPSTVDENTTGNYTATAIFSDGTSEDVTESVSWGEDASSTSIDSNGVLSTSEVTSDQTVTITAYYTADGLTQSAEKVVTIPSSNLAPYKPSITSPYDGQTECELQPLIMTEPFSDPEDHPHGQSQWQISRNANFNSVILDVTSTQQLLELTVPDMFLEVDTTYYVRVRFYDDYMEPSEWSDTVEFTTTAEMALLREYDLSIIGLSSVMENSTASYAARVTFSDGASMDVTQSAGWGEDSPYASVDSNGALTTSEVTSDQSVTIMAFYSYEGITQTVQTVVAIIDSNLAPRKPVILSPYDGEMDCELQPHITTEPFSDFDGDSHGQSQWQVSKNADFDSTILDVTSSRQLTELTVPDMFLEIDTTYYVRVRFYDTDLKPSDWSETVEFVTAAEVSVEYSDATSEEQDFGDDVDIDGDDSTESDTVGFADVAEVDGVSGDVMHEEQDVGDDAGVNGDDITEFDTVREEVEAEPEPLSGSLSDPNMMAEGSEAVQPSLSVNGPSIVNQNTTVSFTATATFSDGTSEDVTESTSWGEDSLYANIDSNGVLSTSEVMGDQSVTITAYYTIDGMTQIAQKVVTIPGSNFAPYRPSITSPYNGQTECELQPLIMAEPFSDPDNDPHAQSQWQISKNSAFGSVILDVTSGQRLTELTVPDMLLEANTTYYVRVRFYDDNLEASGWSDIIEFTTTAQTFLVGQYNLTIGGPSSVLDNTTTNYTVTATFSDGTSEDVTQSAGWGEDSPYASIDSSGALSASEVTSDETVTITAFYTSESVTQTAQSVVTIVDSNLPPSKPVILSPYDGEMECGLQPHITAEAFSDFDGDPHGQSQWQVSKNADHDLRILDLTSTQQLTELAVPDMLLEANTTYYVRVRFYDTYLKPSDWSDTVEFATAAEVNDEYSDAMPEEQDVGDNVDADRDDTEPDMVESTTAGEADDVLGDVMPDEPDIGDDVDIDGDDTESYVDASSQLPILEIGEIIVDNDWKRVEFSKTFYNPVVIAKPMSLDDEEPAVVRIHNVDSTGFDIFVQEWDYLDGLHSEETVGYVVMEAGSYTMPDGSLVEAGYFETDNTTSWAAISFDQAFSEPPVVVAAITTFNETDAVVGRLTGIGTDGFDFSMQEQELNAQEHAFEEVCFIAWEPSSGTIDGLTFEVGRTQDGVNDQFDTIPFTESFANIPVFLADMQTTDGGNTANVRWDSKDFYGVDIKIAEEQSRDGETAHSAEVVGYVVLSIEN